jgi:ABC-2 type transport system ATP-binding protein
MRAASPANGAGQVLLSLEGVAKNWGGQTVLDEVDLDIRAGAITGVAGGNGAGKTTLLRIASGMIIADRGTTRFRGADVTRHRASYQRAIGLLSAGDRGLYARLTVRQNLDVWGGMAGLSRDRRRERIAEVLAEFEIVELADRRVDRLSMGQRQRVRLAMTFLPEPVIVFLDEPRTSLDEAGVSVLADALGGLIGRGGAALWVSPEADEPVVTDHWLLRDGRVHPISATEPVRAVNPVLHEVAAAR